VRGSGRNLDVFGKEGAKEGIGAEGKIDVFDQPRQGEPLNGTRAVDSRIQELAVVRDGEDVRVRACALRRGDCGGRQ
jgi:hypothetical protein